MSSHATGRRRARRSSRRAPSKSWRKAISSITSCPAAARTDPLRPFDRKRILLGVTGGIASYKSAWLARLLTKAGADVDTVLTRSATEFIGAITFEALTGRPVHSGLFDPG